jgi:hypothetical protein
MGSLRLEAGDRAGYEADLEGREPGRKLRALGETLRALENET